LKIKRGQTEYTAYKGHTPGGKEKEKREREKQKPNHNKRYPTKLKSHYNEIT